MGWLKNIRYLFLVGFLLGIPAGAGAQEPGEEIPKAARVDANGNPLPPGITPEDTGSEEAVSDPSAEGNKEEGTEEGEGTNPSDAESEGESTGPAEPAEEEIPKAVPVPKAVPIKKEATPDKRDLKKPSTGKPEEDLFAYANLLYGYEFYTLALEQFEKYVRTYPRHKNTQA
ncbi:MAG: hypothetical protein AAF514_23470, partial [Verrucomicrobiota bacterium]